MPLIFSKDLRFSWNTAAALPQYEMKRFPLMSPMPGIKVTAI